MKRWPIIVANDVFVQHPSAALYRRRAESNMGMGVMMHSDYTGQLCQETGMRLAAQGMSKVGMCISGRDIVSWAVCDVSPVSRAVIKQARAHLRPQHLFEGVCSHVDAKQLKAVQALKGPPIKKNHINSLSPELRTAEIVKAKAA